VKAARKPGLVLAFTLALCGCGHTTTVRGQVAAYIKQVRTIESKLTAPLAAVTQAGAQFSAGGRKTTLLGNIEHSSQQQTLARALTQIRLQGRRLKALKAPPAAGRLRSLLLRLTAAEAAQTHQLQLLVAFLPRFTGALGPLGPAAIRLEAVLAKRQAVGSGAVTALFDAKASALRDFTATTRRVVARLRRLTPPAVSKPEYSAQVASLRGMGASAGRLADALAGGALSNVAPSLLAFDRAAVATHSRAVQRAQIAAVRAYDAKTASLSKLSQAIAEERLRLANTLK
jgi:hypothetical protein